MNMKTLFSKSLTFALALSMATILLVSVSCRSLDPGLYTIHRDSVAYTIHQTIDTIVMHDSVYRHDSVVYRERTIHDTVYITKEVYRNASHSTLNAQHSTHSDTVILTEYRDRVIEHPPERYIPKFYRWCTTILWLLITFAAVYISMRIFLKR
jgi:hypothetical protein